MSFSLSEGLGGMVRKGGSEGDPPRVNAQESRQTHLLGEEQVQAQVFSQLQPQGWALRTLLVLEMLLLWFHQREKKRFKHIWQLAIMKLSLILSLNCTHISSAFCILPLSSLQFLFDDSWIFECLVRPIKGKYIKFHQATLIESIWKS